MGASWTCSGSVSPAARYADHIIAMRDGKVIAQGTPAKVVTCPLIRLIFDLDADVFHHPDSGTPLMIPLRTVAGADLMAVPT